MNGSLHLMNYLVVDISYFGGSSILSTGNAFKLLLLLDLKIILITFSLTHIILNIYVLFPVYDFPVYNTSFVIKQEERRIYGTLLQRLNINIIVFSYLVNKIVWMS